jgi:hypothetical protein
MTIQELLKSSPTAEDTLIGFALRQRNREEDLRISRFKKHIKRLGAKVDDQAFLEVFKQLESMGYGTIVPGRGKIPLKFQFKIPVREVGKAVLGLVDQQKLNSMDKKQQEILSKYKKPAKVKILKPLPKTTQAQPTVREAVDSLVHFKTTIAGKPSEVTMSVDQFLKLLKHAS